MSNEHIQPGEPPHRRSEPAPKPVPATPDIKKTIYQVGETIAGLIVFALVFMYFRGDLPFRLGGSGVAPVTPEERFLAKHITDTSNEPNSVEFARFESEDQLALIEEAKKRGEWKGFETMNDFGKQMAAIVRVAYRHRNNFGSLEFVDTIYYVSREKTILMAHPNPWGDNWRKAPRI